jgi:hypothetical protein
MGLCCCDKCWERPCVCGHEAREAERFREEYFRLQQVITGLEGVRRAVLAIRPPHTLGRQPGKPMRPGRW